MQYKVFVTEQLQSNVYFFYSVKTREAVIFDAGGCEDEILKTLEENDLSLKYIILTHGHFDHIAVAQSLRKKTGAKLAIHELDIDLLGDAELNYSASFPNLSNVALKPDTIIRDGDHIDILGETMKFIHTPGHSKGSMCIEFGKYLITGDTLFKGSIGRTDFYGGSMKSMYESLKLFAKMNKKLIVLPGHGDSSTIADELNKNYYLRRM